MKNSEILNVPAIQKSIRECHQKFLKDYGSAIDKVLADRRLFSDIILTKMYRIALIFREEKIIDDIKISEVGFCKKITITKTSCNDYVDIVTNGESIVMEGFSYTTGFDTDSSHAKESFRYVNSDDFDWVAFSNKMLDYIHTAIYERKAASETRFNSMFEKNTISDYPSVFESSKTTKK